MPEAPVACVCTKRSLGPTLGPAGRRLSARKEILDHLDHFFRLVDEKQVAGAGDYVLSTVGHQGGEDLIVDSRHKRVLVTRQNERRDSDGV